ncbi:phytoene desaturase family protein [Treponema sp. J25]|uniref:phytoene desaturase family protein n=1 Tax=Treponema sp. J25 TaxID=2094121 RepID=UPI00104AD172|nr:phytoene desaturase family protein [Treponema sp. J25]TCW60795.1 phytoene desaturase [Treponema sp. J25]
MDKQVMVIGAGFAGLTTAALLAKEGYRVTILEKCDSPGGRARLWEKDGFAFDMGPSWYLMPEVFDQYFALFGKERSQYYDLVKLKTHYTVHFERHEPVTITSDFEQTKALFETFEAGGGPRLEAYIQNAKYKYDTAMKDFLYREYRHVFQFLNKRLMTEGLRLNVFQALDPYVGRYFKDVRARQILEYAMVFLGASPTNAPALYSLISYLDIADGVYFPVGGMYAIVEGLVKLCNELGVSIEYGAEVTHIDEGEGKTVSVRALKDGQHREYRLDAVVMCGDYAHADRELLDRNKANYSPSYWDRAVLAPSMFIAYLGLNREIPELTHHNLYFSDDWTGHFDTIFKRPAWPENPCFYLSAASKTDRRAAPPGKENLFLLVPTAPGLSDTDEVRRAYYERVLTHVERRLGITIRPYIQVERLFSQRDFAESYHAFKGTALGMAHTLRQTAVFRPAMRSKKIRGLFFAGQYTHPGVGVPMTFIASQVVAPIVDEYLKGKG